MRAHEVDSLSFKSVKNVSIDIVFVVQEHDGKIPEFLLCLVGFKACKSLGRLPSIYAAEHAMVFVK